MTVRRRQEPRRGMAPLELVIAFPLLLCLASGVLYAGRAGLARTKASIATRGVLFKDRDKEVSGAPLRLIERIDLNDGELATAGRKFKHWIGGRKQAGPLGGYVQQAAWAEANTFKGTWDHHSVKFEPKRGLFTPHMRVMTMLVDGGANGIGKTLEGAIGTAGKGLEAVLTNETALRLADTLNTVLDGGALWLEYTLLPVLSLGEAAIKLANKVPFVDLDDLDDSVDVFQDSVEGLIDATKEKPGNWKGDALKWLTQYL